MTYTLWFFGNKWQVSAKAFYAYVIGCVALAITLLYWAVAGWSGLIGWWAAALFLVLSVITVNSKKYAIIRHDFTRDVLGAMISWIGIAAYWVSFSEVYVWLWTY